MLAIDAARAPKAWERVSTLAGKYNLSDEIFESVLHEIKAVERAAASRSGISHLLNHRTRPSRPPPPSPSPSPPSAPTILAPPPPAGQSRRVRVHESTSDTRASTAQELPAVPRLRLAFWEHQLTERGSTLALYDYADFAERILGHRVVLVMYKGNAPLNHPLAVEKVRRRFGNETVVGMNHSDRSTNNVTELLINRNVSHVYIIKHGGVNSYPMFTQPGARHRAGAMVPRGVRTLVHCIFDAREPHGDVYAKISPRVHGEGVPIVPHMVRPLTVGGNSSGGDVAMPDLRSELGIPPNATVFARYGGSDSFNIGFVHKVLCRMALDAQHNATGAPYFLFMNTPAFCMNSYTTRHLDHLIRLPASTDPARKSAFVRAADAMVHARAEGETFGLAIAEFSAANKPILANCCPYGAQGLHRDDRFHLDTLGERAITYKDEATLRHALLSFDRNAAAARGAYWNAYREFEPSEVMRTFSRVFFKGV